MTAACPRDASARGQEYIEKASMEERWLLPHTKDFYLRSEDIRDVTWEERPDSGTDRFTVRITFVHPTIASKQLDDFTWSEVVAFVRRGIVVRKAVPD